jgi:hypothetical protein
MEEKDLRVLECLADRKTAASAEIAAFLGIDLRSVNESFNVLYAAGLLQFADRSGFLSSKNEFILARITEQGILAARQSRTQSTASPGGQAETISVSGQREVAAEADQAKAAVQMETRDLLRGISSLIDSKPDISDYERGDLKKKVEDFGEAISRKDGGKAGQIQSWFSKYAPWIESSLATPEAQEAIKKAISP